MIKSSSKIKTRQAILATLKEHGPQTAPGLASRLKRTPMAIRLHLYDMAAEELLGFEEQKSPRGRPAKYWGLTDKAQHIFPDAHQTLAVDILNSISQTLGPKGLESIITTHSQNQLTSYNKQMAGQENLAARLHKLAEIRTGEGYMAGVKQVGDHWLFHENHCPICSAAKTCTKLCANELWVFQELLGQDITITREEHILAGARRCLYKITHP